jgi:fumarate reductase subunit C
MERKLFVAQRISAMILGPLVLVHLALILIAVRNGLTGAEILERTNGSLVWGFFYGTFVVAAAIHAPIGLRNILREWTGLPRLPVDILVTLFGMVLLGLGLRAVTAII